MVKRAKIFNTDFMATFDEQHETEVGGKAPRGGYPDTGNGKYSVKLSYAEWFEFNNAQRVQYNFLEQIVPIFIWVFVSALYQPLVAAIFGLTYFVGRFFYSIGYLKSPAQRVFGAIICDLAYLGAFVLSIVAVFEISA